MITIVKKIHHSIPLIVKKLSVTCAAISVGLGSYGIIANDTLFIRVGGVCTIISAGLPPLFGLKKDTETITIKEDEITT